MIFRSEKYLRWIRKFPCVKCGKKAEAHHEPLGKSGTGIKPPDSQALPLCHRCHIYLLPAQGPETFWKGYDVKMLIIEYLTLYLQEHGL
jgi:hypothetical protein